MCWMPTPAAGTRSSSDSAAGAWRRCTGPGGTRPTGFTSEVALKGLLEGLEERQSSARLFQYEAEVSGYLSHPNIARASDLERIQGRLYLVLEYVDGVSLRSVIHAAAERKEPMPPEFACYVCGALADALGYAHALPGRDGKPLGIVHRDVSPSNVMVTRKGIPKLLDFGIAFARVPDRDRTATGVVLGTYSYLSPEQAASGQAARGEVDGRSDLFSLGLVLVELLTGKKVFRAEDEYLTAKAIAECSPARVNEATHELPPSCSGCAVACSRRAPRIASRAGMTLPRSCASSWRTAIGCTAAGSAPSTFRP